MCSFNLYRDYSNSFTLSKASELLLPRGNRIRVHNALKYGTKPIRYVTLHSRAVAEIALPQPFFCVNRSSVLYDYRGSANVIL